MSDLSTLAQGLGLNAAQLSQLQSNIATLQSAKLLELDSDIALAQEGSRLTQNGLNLLAKAVAGKQLLFTRAALGDSIRNGEIVTPTPEQMITYTNLISKRGPYLPLADVRFTGAGTATITFIVDNKDLPTGFWAREIGLFARDPDTQAEVLYCYRNTGALATYIPAGGGAVAITLSVNLITVVDQATNVTSLLPYFPTPLIPYFPTPLLP